MHLVSYKRKVKQVIHINIMTKSTHLDTENKPSYHVTVEIIVIQVPTRIQKINQVKIVIQVPTWIQKSNKVTIIQLKSYKYKGKNRFRYPLDTQTSPLLYM